jgi:hypothetical protein
MYVKPLGDISHAQRRLIGLIEKREFTGTLIGDWQVPQGLIVPIYKSAVGQRTPTYGIIFGLRRHIPPEAWYFDETEKLPKPIACTHLYPPFGARINKKIIHDETAAINLIGEIRENRKLSAFCVEHGLKYNDMLGCAVKRKRSNGRYGYHQKPAYLVIRTLREIIHPALWYLFPDELETQEKK